ncbi:MAG TPA: hypothetical protein VNX60_05045 [Candidatus Acidoferrum sp.]|nr:hypothetical protein [Candidatus Acidoferrum sp.]
MRVMDPDAPVTAFDKRMRGEINYSLVAGETLLSQRTVVCRYRLAY